MNDFDRLTDPHLELSDISEIPKTEIQRCERAISRLSGATFTRFEPRPVGSTRNHLAKLAALKAAELKKEGMRAGHKFYATTKPMASPSKSEGSSCGDGSSEEASSQVPAQSQQTSERTARFFAKAQSQASGDSSECVRVSIEGGAEKLVAEPMLASLIQAENLIQRPGAKRLEETGSLAAERFKPQSLANYLSHQGDKDLFEYLNRSTQVHMKSQQIAACSQEEVTHRFTNIECPQLTAIRVGSSFLHANRVKLHSSDRAFICCQAPMLSELSHFWRLNFESELTIIDLTHARDMEKADVEGGVKPYYPTKVGVVMRQGDLEIELQSIQGDLHQYGVRDRSTKQVKTLQRLHFDQWPDYGVITTSELSELVDRMESIPRALVHCRAGVGRTGTIVTAYYLKEGVMSGSIDGQNSEKALLSIILQLRQQRGSHFVQSQQQLALLRSYGQQLLSSKLGASSNELELEPY